MLVQMPLHNPQISRVGSEKDVEHVPGNGYRAQRGIESDIASHMPQFPLRQAKVLCFPYEIGAHRGCQHVTQDRNQPGDSVKPDGAIDAGNDKASFKHHLKRLDPLADGRRIIADRNGDTHWSWTLALVQICSPFPLSWE